MQHTVHVDATLTHVGGVWGSRTYSLPLPDLIQGLVPITQAEMFNIVVALQMWAHCWQDKVIAVRCDNESAVYVCNTGKTRDTFLNICLQRIWHLTSKYNIDLRLSHISGKSNVVADALSHRQFHKLGDLQWDVLSPQVLSSLCSVETKFTGVPGSRLGQITSILTTSHEKAV